MADKDDAPLHSQTFHSQTLHSQTLAVRAGQTRSNEQEHAEALYLTSSYVFENAAEMAKCFVDGAAGNVYSRYTNPTVRMFEERIAAMEGGEAAVATGSGMAAIMTTLMGLLQAGDHMVCSRNVFGSTKVLFDKFFVKFGVSVSYVDLTDLADWQAAINDSTRLFFLETPSNPLGHVVDLVALCKIAHQREIKVVVDNCFCTPALQQPLALGVDVVVHSATKYLDGQGRCLGGVCVGSAETIEPILGFLRSGGPSMSPFNAWIFLKGLETLHLRMKAHCDNAQALAEWLQQHPKVENVYYAGLPDHPCHELAKRQQTGFGGVLAFTVGGGREAAWHVIDSCQLLSRTANLGDAKTTIVHPATTTHGRISEEDRDKAGITENLIRVSAGLEHIDDIVRDIERGLATL